MAPTRRRWLLYSPILFLVILWVTCHFTQPTFRLAFWQFSTRMGLSSGVVGISLGFHQGHRPVPHLSANAVAYDVPLELKTTLFGLRPFPDMSIDKRSSLTWVVVTLPMWVLALFLLVLTVVIDRRLIRKAKQTSTEPIEEGAECFDSDE